MKPPLDHHVDLTDHDIQVRRVLRNIAPAQLYEEALNYDRGSAIADSGALIISSGAKTGRSPGDKRVAVHPDSRDRIWWGSVNVPLQENNFLINLERAVDYLNTRERLYVTDGYAGWDPRYRLKIRVICTRAYHALFMYNMMIRPSEKELEEFGEPDFMIYNAGHFPANLHTEEMTSKTSIDLSFERREMVILGTEYAGEMKKGVFTVMHYLMPMAGQLSMHCSANTSAELDNVALFFGLSGTGKTTLSADPRRRLVGDDEHVWSDRGVFNIEGGCYAKCIGLTEENEPEIYRAIRYGTVLENVVYDPDRRQVDYDDNSVTENTRAAYPIEFIPNAVIPCQVGHPRNVIFLTCDAFGVLPPVSRLNPDQAMYHFISGYTAKVAGTEVGVTEPSATFSACFGAAFLALHPSRYAELMGEKIQRHQARVWLVNTGWSGGPYGVGSRFSLPHTRAIIDGIHDGSLDQAPAVRDSHFGFDMITECPGVPHELMVPERTWPDRGAYRSKARELAGLFKANFRKFEQGTSAGIRQAGPA